MGEKSNVTFMVGEDQDGHTFTISGLQDAPEIQPDLEVNTEEDLTRVLRSGTESATFKCRIDKKGANRLRWQICKYELKTAFYYLRLILKSVFSKEG